MVSPESMGSYKIHITPQAKQDLRDIFDYIYAQSQNESIANGFINKLVDTLKETLGYMPNKHTVYQGNIRRFVFTDNKNYCAYFSIDETTESVAVLAITNTSQYTRYSKLF